MKLRPNNGKFIAGRETYFVHKFEYIYLKDNEASIRNHFTHHPIKVMQNGGYTEWVKLNNRDVKKLIKKSEEL